MRFIALSLALVLATCQPAFAQQDTARCATVTVSRATAADIPDLIADAECFAKALQSAANSQALRLAKAKELAQHEPVPETPDHGGHPMPDPPAFKPLTVGDITPIELLDVGDWTLPHRVPASAAPDKVGAFRLTGNMSHLSYDDPIVYPGQPGKAHLHVFSGNTLANAFSTYESLRTSGDSTFQGDLLNRSAYWIPAMLNGAGQVVIPDWQVLYYKRFPDGEARCQTEGKACVGIPAGLRAIFGTNYKLNERQSPRVSFDCGTSSPTLAVPAAVCKPGDQLFARITAPNCWDGVNLDSADHQSHLAYQTRHPNTGRPSCPATHPYIIPELTLTTAFTVEAGDTPARWHFSSDAMAGAPAGSTYHADYMEAWEPEARLAWEAACIGKLLNCSDGDMGDGRILKRPAGFTFTQRPRLVPVPKVGETVSLR